MKSVKRRQLITAAGALASAAVLPSWGQDKWPSKPIRPQVA